MERDPARASAVLARALRGKRPILVTGSSIWCRRSGGSCERDNLEGRLTVTSGDITLQLSTHRERGQSLAHGRRRRGRRHPSGWRPGDPRGVPRHPREGCPTGSRRRGGGDHGGAAQRTWVIHTVGPVWRGEQRRSAEACDCYTKSLELAESSGAGEHRHSGHFHRRVPISSRGRARIVWHALGGVLRGPPGAGT